MGCSYSKPWKNKYEGVIAAYQWEQRECGCGSNQFKLVEEPKDDAHNFASAKDIIEPKLSDAVDIIMENATRSCCCSALTFDVAVSGVNTEWAPDVNKQLERLGYEAEAFSWSEWQYNGQTAYEATYFVIRIKEVGTKVS
jgi:hypothetical protein